MAVVVQCVKDGSKLRIKPVTEGYKPDWYVQFPKNLREEGQFYLVDALIEANNGNFYRTYGNIYKLKKE